MRDTLGHSRRPRPVGGPRRFRRENVENYICLADIVGYGPELSARLQRIRKTADHVVAGSDDLAVADLLSIESFNLLELKPHSGCGTSLATLRFRRSRIYRSSIISTSYRSFAVRFASPSSTTMWRLRLTRRYPYPTCRQRFAFSGTLTLFR